MPVLGGAVLLASACSTTSSAETVGDEPLILATTEIWADVVGEVACDTGVQIDAITPARVDPHEFEPSLAQRVAMERAALIVENGLNLEVGLLPAIASLDESTPVFTVSDYVPVLSASGRSGGDGERSSSDAGADPHIWLDPNRVRAILPALGGKVEAALGLAPGALDRCVSEFTAELEALDAEIASSFTSLSGSQRQIVTNHDALGYFVDSYGLTVLGTVLPGTSSLASASPKTLEALVAVMEANDVSVIFTEEGRSSADAQAIARIVGDVELVALQVAWLDSTTPSYLALMRNLTGSLAAGMVS